MAFVSLSLCNHFFMNDNIRGECNIKYVSFKKKTYMFRHYNSATRKWKLFICTVKFNDSNTNSSVTMADSNSILSP